ncbi:MAG: tetratricopeptide repeat protein, partial [Kiloniellales bacterium]
MSEEGVERKLAAIFAADVVGYSRLMGEDEAGTLARLKSLRKELVQPKIAGGRGRIVKLMGDGLLAEFPSVVEAVRCAVDIQQGMAGREPGLPDERRLRLRIGVNLGDIIVEGSDIYGDGVNVAARLEGLAEPGGICISGKVYEEVRNKLPTAFEDLGEQEVKNIPEPVRVYRWTEAAADPTPGMAGAEGALPLPDKPTIAVLPFTNMSGDPEQEYFSDGITEDIITELSRFNEFAVIARNSTFHYKGQSPKIEDVGRELGVKYVVEGSVRRAADRVRVTAQLIDTETKSHIWADRYDRKLVDIFAIQDEVTEAVVARVADKVKGAATTLSRSRPKQSVTAYDLVLQSRPYRASFTRTGSEQAAKLLTQAIVLDPDYALAHASLAFVRAGEYEEGWAADSDAALRDTLAAARQAVALDGSDGYAHASLAYAYYQAGNFDRSIHEAHTALSLNPNHVNIIMTLGWISVVVGDPEAGIEHIQRARRLNPYMGGFDLWTLGLAYFDAKRYEEAIDVFSQVDPPTSLYLTLAAACAYLGRDSDARNAMNIFLDRAKDELNPFPGDDPRAWRRYLERWIVRRRKEDLEHMIEG